MQKKEYYKHNLPHFQQPGQAYFVTWSLKDAVPKHKLKHFTQKLEILKSQMNSGSGLAVSKPPLYESQFGNCETQLEGLANSNTPLESRNGIHETQKDKSRIGIHETRKNEKLQREYNILRRTYLKVYNDLLDAQKNPMVDLSKPENTRVMVDALKFWNAKKLKNHAFCIMPNHVHWVLELLEKDEVGKPVYLQDILYSVKRFSATQINKLENRIGSLWQKESFDTTIRDEKHMYYAIEYTLNNPVNTGFVEDWKEWEGIGLADSIPRLY